MAAAVHLLDDRQMQQFLRDGYLVLKPNFPPEFHHEVYQRSLSVLEQEGNPLNNILGKVSVLQEFFEHSVVRARSPASWDRTT